MVNKAATFLVRARGESMHGEGATIQDGDLLVVDRSKSPKNGDIAVACIDGGFTVKRIRATGHGIWLVPENKSFPEIKIEADQDFIVWGVVTARVSQFLSGVLSFCSLATAKRLARRLLVCVSRGWDLRGELLFMK